MNGVHIMKKWTAENTKKLSIEGIIIPNRWDEENRVTSLVLSSPGEVDYDINLSGDGKELLKHVGRKVRLQGNLLTDKPGRELAVEAFTICDWSET